MIPGAVHILTTNGPVAIQRISEEDPGVSSVICLDGLTQILPISREYDAFVRRPAGIVERMTGHGAYRMDVSARIDEGRSWQLGAYIAHAIKQQGGTGCVTVFATGEVDTDLNVRAVDHIDIKLRALAQTLTDTDFDIGTAIILIPESEGSVPDQIGGIPVSAITHVDAVFSATGIAQPEMPDASVMSAPEVQARRRHPLVVLLGAALISAVLFWIGGDFARWAGLMEQGRILELEQDLALADTTVFGSLRADAYKKWLNISKKNAAAIDISGAIFVAENEANCKVTSTRKKLEITSAYEGTESVCAVEISASSETERAVIIGRLAYWPQGIGGTSKPGRVMRGRRDTSRRTWALAFDELPKAGAALRLIVIVGDVDINGAQPWNQALLAEPLDSPAFDAARQRVQRFGFEVLALNWRRQ